jgi:hypothetical protein
MTKEAEPLPEDITYGILSIDIKIALGKDRSIKLDPNI